MSLLRIAYLSLVVAYVLSVASALTLRFDAPRLWGQTSSTSLQRLLGKRYYQSNHESEAFIADIPLSSVSVSSTREQARQEWVDKSLEYYSKVMREERRRNLGQVREYDDYNYDFLQLAKRHYFALRKIKDGKHQHAETLYRRIIDDLLHEEEEGECDHAKLAVTTLLLALHLQRTGDTKATRSVFLSFFRAVMHEASKEPDHTCACSAKVIQAFALFEMKQGFRNKSLDLVLIAIKLDPTLRPILKWKQFRDAISQRESRTPVLGLP